MGFLLQSWQDFDIIFTFHKAMLTLFIPNRVQGIVRTPIRFVTVHFGDRRGTASLHHRNRAATTVLVCEQKPYVRFDFRGGSKPMANLCLQFLPHAHHYLMKVIK